MRHMWTHVTRAAGLLLAAGLGGAAWAEPSDVQLDNRLADCVNIIDYRYLLESEMPYLVVEIAELRSPVECGCNTPAGAYRVRALSSPITRASVSTTGTEADMEGVDLLGARVLFEGKRYKQLPLASGVELTQDKDLEVTLVCAR